MGAIAPQPSGWERYWELGGLSSGWGAPTTPVVATTTRSSFYFSGFGYPALKQNQAFSKTVSVFRDNSVIGPYSCELRAQSGSSVPTGMTVSMVGDSAVKLSGTPTVSGTFYVEARVNGYTQSTNAPISTEWLSSRLEISPAAELLPPRLVVSANALAQASVGVSYNNNGTPIVNAVVENSDYVADPTITYGLPDRGNLPSGVSINSSTGVIQSFTPPTAGTYTFKVRASCAGISSSQVVTCTISTTAAQSERFIVNWQPQLQVAQVNVAFSAQLGTGTYGASSPVGTWAAENISALPSGAAVSSSGVLTCTFTESGAFGFSVTCTYNGETQRGTFTVQVGAGNTGTGGTPTPLQPSPPAPVIATYESDITGVWYEIHMAQDDKNGRLLPTVDSTGTVDYDAGEVYFPVEEMFQSRTWKGPRTNAVAEWAMAENSDTFADGGKVSVAYRPLIVEATDHTETLDTQPLVFSLTPLTADTVIPGTVRFTLGSTVYEDNEGVIQHTVNPGTGVGTIAGTIDYRSGNVTLTNWVAGSAALSIQSLATYRGQFTETEFFFRTAGAPLRPGSVQVSTVALDGEQLVGLSEVDGDIVGDDLDGFVDVEFGTVNLRFGNLVLDDDLTPEEKAEEWYNAANIDEDGYIWKPRKVIPPTTSYNATLYSYLPLSAELLGLSPVRLPVDGRVPFVKKGDTAAVHHTDSFTITGPISGGDAIDCGRTRIARFWILDADGVRVSESKYSMNLDSGVGSFVPGFTLGTNVLPFTAYHRIVDEVLVTDVDVSGQVTFFPALTHVFPIGSYLSTEWPIPGDMGARIARVFSLQTWSHWDATAPETPITGQFNQSLYPIVTTNDGAIQQEWRISFTSSTTVNVIGQSVGQINTSGTLSIASDIAPINPITSKPYFTIPNEGWGAGWVSGNQLRFTTYAADYPIDLLRCVQAGAAAGDADRLSLEFLGDVDA